MTTLPDTEIDLTSVVGQTLDATQFATVATVQIGLAPGASNAGPIRWDQQDGPAWTEGGGASLTYNVTSVNNQYQVIAINVATQGGAHVATIYGQVISFTPDTFLMMGYESFDPATGTLGEPLSSEGGTLDTFIMSDLALAENGHSNSTNWQIGAPFRSAPFDTTALPAACFAVGTLIGTPGGPVAVEQLAAGDLVVVHGGASQAVRWVSHRQCRCDQSRQPARVRPVRVQAGAFGGHLPQRDLFLSPEHAVFQEGVLVPIHRLVNGTTIRQVTAPDVTYYHVALDNHGVLFAEGLPAESYLETGGRFGRAACHAEPSHRAA